jgi:hypothetical protein
MKIMSANRTYVQLSATGKEERRKREGNDGKGIQRREGGRRGRA